MTGAVPAPVSETLCGLFEALSVMVSAPVREPLAVGVKVTLTVQLELAATLVPQLLVCAKSPLAVMLETLAAAVPVFDTMTGCDALLLPSTCAEKVSVLVDTAMTGAVPVPVSETLCGLFERASARAARRGSERHIDCTTGVGGDACAAVVGLREIPAGLNASDRDGSASRI